MRTIRTKLYKFEELNKEAQQTAIEKFRESNEIFLDCFNEYAEEQIKEAGFYEDIKLKYSLSYSQGDGLSFSCERVSNDILLPIFAGILGEGKEKTAKLIIDNCYFVCTGNTGHYCFASKSDLEYEFDSGINAPNIESVVGKVEKALEDLYMTLCKMLEKSGYADIEYQQSGETIKETIIANEYEFLSNGKLY